MVEWGHGSDQPEPCDQEAGTNRWRCADAEWGELVISVSDAGPYEPFVAEVTVGHNGCHPITETLDAVLQYLPD